MIALGTAALSPPEPAERIARLRPERAAVYPEIPAGIWFTAWTLGWVIAAAVSAQARPPVSGRRVLRDDCFDFLGGAPRPPGWRAHGTRRHDP
jgi:hypothetical protein